jgi:hypothetical protein
MLMAEAADAIVEIEPPESMVCPTNSGNVYVSEGNKVLLLTIKFELLDELPTVIKFTEIVAALTL